MERSIKKRYSLIKYFGFFVIVVCFNTLKAQQIGDQGIQFDSTKNDPAYPFMIEWQKAGVEDGIPLQCINQPQIEIDPTDTDGIQQAIDNSLTNNDLFVILLKNGVYDIDKPIRMKSNIILRGESKEGVKLNVTIRSNGNNTITSTEFTNIQNAALENLSFEYLPPMDIKLYDDSNVPRNAFCGDMCFNNNPNGIDNMYVSFVEMLGTTKNCWVDNCNFKNAGTDPVEIRADHNTFRNNFIDGAFNRGGGGNAYYDITGNHNLITNERVRRIRHFAIQLGAKYNVVTQCDIEVDVNFHNGDDGFNLVENNNVKSEQWRSWAAFATGNIRFGHEEPGENNIIFNNRASGRGNSSLFSSRRSVFVFDQYVEPRLLTSTPPSGNTFYPVILEDAPLIFPSGTDIANGKPAFQSSTLVSDRGAERALDNNVTSFNQTTEETDPWWEVDLENQVNIGQIKIWNRQDCCQNRLKDFNIEIYDQRGGNLLRSIPIFEEVSSLGSTYDIDTEGSVVRIQLKGEGKELHMGQISVFERGDSNPDNAPIGELISLQKSGGDQRFVSVNDDNELIANKTTVENDEKFMVQRHPKGGVMLFSLKTNQFIHPNGISTNQALLANNNGFRACNRFKWEDLGNGQVALFSYLTNKWVNAPWRIDNTKLFPQGNAVDIWETFNWQIESPNNLSNDQFEANSNNNIIIFPNPVRNTSIITLKNLKAGSIHIFNVLGQLIETKNVSNSELELDITNLSSGIYFIKNEFKTTKLIIE